MSTTPRTRDSDMEKLKQDVKVLKLLAQKQQTQIDSLVQATDSYKIQINQINDQSKLKETQYQEITQKIDQLQENLQGITKAQPAQNQPNYSEQFQQLQQQITEIKQNITQLQPKQLNSSNIQLQNSKYPIPEMNLSQMKPQQSPTVKQIYESQMIKNLQQSPESQMISQQNLEIRNLKIKVQVLEKQLLDERKTNKQLVEMLSGKGK